MRALVLALLATGCVKGNPGDPAPEFTDTGGTLAIDGCGYSLTTRIGAEPPRKAPAAGAATAADLDPTPRLIHLGIMGDPKTSMVAQWRTVDETTRATVIRYAAGANLTADKLTETANGVEFGYRATGTQIYRMHQAHLCGLLPGTAYSYQVGSTDHFSQVYSFTTAPDIVANPDAEVLLANVGDSRDGYDVWGQLIQELDERAPDLVLFTGDAVTIGITQFEWEAFFERAEPLFARVPMVSAHGNHEVNAVNYFSQIAMPGDQETFGFDYGHAHITVANDTPEDISYMNGKFKDAIATDLEASKNARWKIFMHHRPMYSASTSHGSSLDVREAWLPLVDQYKVDLVIAGHDHDYEISKPMRGNAVQATNADGTVYVVSGGAGAELYGADMLFHTLYSEKTHSAAVIRVRRDSMVMESFRQDGSAIPTAFSKSK
jgi:Calcineurin-like phosphoesterase/Purple acid Phosphatase, N-terminal domain